MKVLRWVLVWFVATALSGAAAVGAAMVVAAQAGFFCGAVAGFLVNVFCAVVVVRVLHKH